MIKWKQIEEAPDYWISNRGEVLSKRIEGKEKLIKLFANQKTGYLQCCLIITPKGDPKRKKVTVYPHQLCAQYFVDNPDNLNRVHHKDHQKNNNHYWNLKWVTQEINIWEYYHSDEKNKPRNMKRVEAWTASGDYIGTYPSVNKAAKEIGVCPSTVHNQCTGKSKVGKVYQFKYEK